MKLNLGPSTGWVVLDWVGLGSYSFFVGWVEIPDEIFFGANW